MRLHCIVPSLPNLFADQQENRHRECRESLGAVMRRFGELRDGGVAMTDLKTALPPERRQPYTYVFAESVTVASQNKPPAGEELARQLAKVRTLVDPGVRGTCPDCTLTIACVGNTDDDPELDLLSLSSQDRYVFGDSPVRAGETYVHQKDFASDPEQPARFEPSDAGR